MLCYARITSDGLKYIEVKMWLGLQDSNLRPPGPKPGALPDCAKPRHARLLTRKTPDCKTHLMLISIKKGPPRRAFPFSLRND